MTNQALTSSPQIESIKEKIMQFFHIDKEQVQITVHYQYTKSVVLDIHINNISTEIQGVSLQVYEGNLALRALEISLVTAESTRAKLVLFNEMDASGTFDAYQGITRASWSLRDNENVQTWTDIELAGFSIIDIIKKDQSFLYTAFSSASRVLFIFPAQLDAEEASVEQKKDFLDTLTHAQKEIQSVFEFCTSIFVAQ